MFSLDSYLNRSDELVWRLVDSDVVILTADGREIHTLNNVGSAIWELSDGTRNIGEIITLICERFDVSYEVAHADVLEFVDQLTSKNVLQITDVEAGDDDGD
jgi:hypothetical protein